MTQSEHDKAKQELGFGFVEVGETESLLMDFTIAVFKISDVPPGTKVYIKEEAAE